MSQRVKDFLRLALGNCANQPYNARISRTYRLIEAALCELKDHPSGRTLEEVAKSTFAEDVNRVLAEEKNTDAQG